MRMVVTGLILVMLSLPAWPLEPVPATKVAPVTTEPAAPTPGTNASAAKEAAALQPAVQTSPSANAPSAQDRLELETTQITGNRELPRVLYVVPWKRPDLGDLAGRPANSLLDEVLAPVDRDVFRRQNRYYEALKPDSASGAKVNRTEVEK
jgi:hypothetical protein